ncbi:hypothetical protein V3C99_011048 [Haemonchus contortus]
MSKSAFVIGATGAVGRQLVEALIACNQFKRIVLIGRRRIPLNCDIIEQAVVDFDAIESHPDLFKDIDVGFCAFGTTYAKSAMGLSPIISDVQTELYKVDHDYVVNTAKVARAQGVKEFILVSALGASEHSWLLYFKTKGAVERDIAKLNFDKFVIARPGMFETVREESRPMESFVRLLVQPLKLVTNAFSIPATDVAKAMVVAACSTDLEGVVIWENATLFEKKELFDDFCRKDDIVQQTKEGDMMGNGCTYKGHLQNGTVGYLAKETANGVVRGRR